MSVNVVILVRVSTRDQKVDRQISDLEAFSQKQGWTVTEVIASQVSGSRVHYQQREDLVKLQTVIEGGKVHKVLVHEVSRIGRSPVETLQFVETCHEHAVSVYDFSQQSETLTLKGRPTVYANVILPLLAGLARNENEERRERILSGLQEARRKGKKLGRPAGTRMTEEAFLDKHRDICKRLKEGHSIRNTAKITGKGVSTVRRVKGVMG